MPKTGIARRQFLKAAAATGLASTLSAQNLFAESTKKKKAIFVYGGWNGHEPEKCRDIFVPFLKESNFDVSVSDSLDIYLDTELMAAVDVIVQIWTMGQISQEQEKALLEAVKNGAGLAGWHGGLCDAFRQNTEYQFMTGGQWVAHPGGKIDYDVNIVNSEDPITLGLEDFKINSEQYYMHVDPNVKVLVTTRFSGDHAYWINGAVMPVTWKKIYGKGRVFYSSLGHEASVFEIPQALEMQKRGILWAAESKYIVTPNLISPVYPSM